MFLLVKEKYNFNQPYLNTEFLALRAKSFVIEIILRILTKLLKDTIRQIASNAVKITLQLTSMQRTLVRLNSIITCLLYRRLQHFKVNPYINFCLKSCLREHAFI